MRTNYETQIVSMDSIEAKAPSWLWNGYIVRLGLNLVVGAKGVGKTSFVCWLAARASLGDEQFGGQPLRVFIDSLEDDAEIVLRPRIEAAGAAMHLIETRKPGEPGWKFPDDIDALDNYLRSRAGKGSPVALVILDSLAAFVPRFTTPQETDVTLETLTRVCEQHQCALVFVHHFNESGRTIDAAIGGATAISRIARSIYLLGEEPAAPARFLQAVSDKGDAEEGQGERALVLACQKLNIAAKPAALRFTTTTARSEEPRSDHGFTNSARPGG